MRSPKLRHEKSYVSLMSVCSIKILHICYTMKNSIIKNTNAHNFTWQNDSVALTACCPSPNRPKYLLCTSAMISRFLRFFRFLIDKNVLEAFLCQCCKSGVGGTLGELMFCAIAARGQRPAPKLNICCVTCDSAISQRGGRRERKKKPRHRGATFTAD